jgi:hypothetical protein
VTGFVVGIPALFFKMDFFVDLTSVGTFFAFILVCGGILYLDHKGISAQSKFRVPYLNGKYLVGYFLLWLLPDLYIRSGSNRGMEGAVGDGNYRAQAADDCFLDYLGDTFGDEL